MTGALLVTGATGSVGSNLCRIAAERGTPVKALVRDLGAAQPLRAFGVELVPGDVTKPETVAAAAQGVDTIIHAAAQIGGTWTTATDDDFLAVNQHGTFNVLDAAKAAHVSCTVVLLSTAVSDRRFTITEISPMLPIDPANSPYARTKLAAYYEGMARAARGLGVTFVLPGAIYGPTPQIDRALVPTIITETHQAAARGDLTSYLPSRMSWVLASEVAEVSLAAAEKGRSGARYLALGRPEEVCSLPEFCNRFCEMAGIDRHVSEIDVSDPAALSQYGSMVKYLQATYPDPPHDPSGTTAELGIIPGPIEAGLRSTIEWLRQHGKI
jgi:dihydroflavonol-4-reductase